jgi:redox-sensitive bicupin YhaK (pirin superfamily)
VRTETIEVRRAGTRFRTRTDGTDTHHSFSFGVHYDPENVAFGPLLVHNDDRVQTGAGYPDHPHRDAEIVTWVLEGSLVHEDSAGNRGVIVPGLAQRMSAGSGIVHAERNDAYRVDPSYPAAPVRFVQMWLRPDTPGGPPSYEQRGLDLGDLDTGWVPVASGHHPDAAVSLDSAGSTLWVTRLSPGTSRLLPAGTRQHAYLADGEVEVSSIGRLVSGDALRLTGGGQLRLTGVRAAELLVWEMAG